jgi:hypothetical protein
MQAGPIIPEQVQMWFNINGLEVRATPAAMTRAIPAFEKKYPGYDWIVIQEKGVIGSSSNMPFEVCLDDALSVILKDAGTSIIDCFTDKNNRKIYILKTKTSQTDPPPLGG